MITKKGKMMYVPYDILEELEVIKVNDKIQSRSEAFRKLKHYANEGMNIQQNIDCSRLKKRKQSGQLFPGDFFNE